MDLQTLSLSYFLCFRNSVFITLQLTITMQYIYLDLQDKNFCFKGYYSLARFSISLKASGSKDLKFNTS